MDFDPNSHSGYHAFHSTTSSGADYSRMKSTTKSNTDTGSSWGEVFSTIGAVIGVLFIFIAIVSGCTG